MPIAISVNMFGLARTTDSQPRAKNGQPPHSTTGVASASWRRATTRGSIACGAAMPPIARPRSGRVSSALHTRRRVIAASSGLSPSALTARGSSAMPHTGQEPGSSRTTSGCIGQTYSPAPGAAVTRMPHDGSRSFPGAAARRTGRLWAYSWPSAMQSCKPSHGGEPMLPRPAPSPWHGVCWGRAHSAAGRHMEGRTVRMRNLSSLIAFVALLAAGPLPARACTTDAECDYGYVYKDLNGLLGPIRLAVIRNGKPSKVQGLGPALNFSLRADPQPVHVVLRFGTLNDCLSFGGTKFKFVPDAAFRALHAPPPATCP